jgi:glycosyltransferase involved in cell wall biosynthesis
MLLLPISNKKDSNLIIFIFILSSVFENILDRQLGIYSFLWFSFLSINRATNNEIKLYVNGRFLTQKTTGVQRVAYEVVSRLQKIYGDKLVVLIPSNKKIEDSKLKNFNIEKIGFFNNFLWEQVELPLYLKRKESILLLNLCNSQPIMSRKINITVLHDVAFARESKWFTKKFKFWYLFMTKLTLHKNIAIITVSNFSKKEIIDKYSQVNSQKINVVYLASFLEPNFEIINNLTEKYFLSVASYDPRKNLKTIINGFNKFCTKHDNVYLKLVGRKSSTFDEINLCSENKKIIFLEDVSDEELKNIYKKAIGFISASYYEGFGLPILESISQKTICLVSDIDVYREIFNDKVLYFNNNKSEDLEKLMEDVLFNDYNVIKEKLENFNLEFSWDKTAQNYFKIINDYHKF